ncbi:hypothetical protein GCM10007036_07270 [Alsobacter metallidurans]|uniref:Uncharacterized protein n=1 Tax=Alsobacter metallidurans TaxID=340221 RepID=A0A917MID6_9HYPH|nr:hypothetical protein [Alsobacter metallidurans]GGH10631.1 hypothetical protein GCM10007036_07270 [Alsobacter metallidurans]
MTVIPLFPTPRDEIVRLEEQIEALGEAVERSRKLITLSRAAAVLGAVSLVVVATGVAALNSSVTLFGIATLLGGMVLAGSSRSTLDEHVEALEKARQARDALIDEVAPVSVTLH